MCRCQEPLSASERAKNMEIRKISGRTNWFIVNIPPKYAKALDLVLGNYMELYLVNKLFLVMKKFNHPSPQGLRNAVEEVKKHEQQNGQSN